MDPILTLDNYTEIELSFVYNGRLAGFPYETKPSIFWWTSTIRNAKKGTAWIKITWSDEKGQVSSKLNVTIKIDNKSPLRFDDCIWAECIVLSPNEENRYCGQRAGIGGLFIKDIFNNIKKSGHTKKHAEKMELRLPTFISENREYLKGRLDIEIDEKNIRKIMDLRFEEEQSEYEITNENMDKIGQILGMNVKSTYFPFSDEAKNEGLYFSAVDERIEGIHAPYWVNNLTVPGLFYWINYCDSEPDEKFVSNLARIALDRNEISEDDFIDIVERQLGESKIYHKNFNKCISAVGTMLTIPSTSLYYKSDETYVSNDSDSMSSKMKKKAIESFNDPLQLLSGDCEDVSNLIHKISRMLEFGKWTDRLLIFMKEIMRIYVTVGTLGSVTAPKIGDERRGERPLLINSEEDLKSDIGAHMWCEMIPVKRFERWMNRMNKGHPFHTYDDERNEWEDELPVMILEGTGLIKPFLRPFSEYHEEEAKIQAEEFHRSVLRANECLFKFSKYLSAGQNERIPDMVKDIEDARVSFFYRQQTELFTDKFMNEQWQFGHFMSTYLSPRIQEKKRSHKGGIPIRDPISDRPDKPQWGVNVRDILKDAPNIGLVTFPVFFKEEKECFKSILRQFPPTFDPELTDEGLKDFDNLVGPHVERFQSTCDEITKDRKQKRSDNIQKVSVIFRSSEFLTGKFIEESENGKTEKKLTDAILGDIEKNLRIIKCKCTLEVITDRFFNVRLDLLVNTPSEEELKEMISERKKHVHKISSMLTNGRHIISQRITDVTVNSKIQWMDSSKKVVDEELISFSTPDKMDCFISGFNQMKLKDNLSLAQLRLYSKGKQLATSRKGLAPKIVLD